MIAVSRLRKTVGTGQAQQYQSIGVGFARPVNQNCDNRALEVTGCPISSRACARVFSVCWRLKEL